MINTETNSQPAIHLTGLSKRFGRTWAVDELSLDNDSRDGSVLNRESMAGTVALPMAGSTPTLRMVCVWSVRATHICPGPKIRVSPSISNSACP